MIDNDVIKSVRVYEESSSSEHDKDGKTNEIKAINETNERKQEEVA